jgi:hypothetical protein
VLAKGEEGREEAVGKEDSRMKKKGTYFFRETKLYFRGLLELGLEKLFGEISESGFSFPF